MLKMAVMALSLLPLVSSADQMVIQGTVIEEGELADKLLTLAGEPQAVRYEDICLKDNCKETVKLARWIYVRDDAKYTVGVYENRVTSVVRSIEP